MDDSDEDDFVTIGNALPPYDEGIIHIKSRFID